MAKYRAAMVGCGLMGAEHARGYAAHPDVELVAAADPNPDNLASFGDRFGIPVGSRYSSYRDLLGREKVDILGVVTPVNVTHDIVMAAVEARPRAIFAEKPIAASLAEADEMVDSCRRAGIAFACGAIWRNHPYLQEARRLIHEEGVIGRVLSINMLDRSEEISGGGCHTLNVVRLLANSEVDWAIGWTKRDPFDDRDQGAGGYLHFASGVETFIHVETGPKQGVEVLGEWGVFLWDWRNVYLWRTIPTWEDNPRYGELQPIPFPYPRLKNPEIYPAITNGLQSVIDAVEKGGEPLTSGDDMRRVLEIAVALRESARQGKVPVQLPIPDRSLKIVPRDRRWLGVKPVAELTRQTPAAGA